MRRFIGGLLSIVFCCQAAPRTVKDDVARMRVGAPVKVWMLDDTNVRGRLSRVEDDAFVLTVSQARDAGLRRILFSEVRSVKKEQPPLARRVVQTIGGIIALPIVVAFTGLEVANGWVGSPSRY